MSQVSYGTITITDTTDIERIYTVYAKSADNTTVPSIAKESWSENVSTAPGSGNYIWQRTVVEKSGTGDKTYSDPVCLTGEEGTDATEISGIEVRYGISADWNTQPTSWSADTPAYDSSKPKYWTRTRLVYDTNPATYSDPVYTKDEALTKAVSDSAIANSIAQHANEDAQGAMSQSSAALQRVQAKYGTSSTAVTTAAKVASCEGFQLFNGAEVFIKFTNKNNVANPTLNVNSTGAKSIRDSDGNALDSKFYWKDGSLVHFVYDGTYWRILDIVTTEKYNNLVSDIDGISRTVGTKASQTDLTNLTTRVSTNETNISQTATSITSLVSNQDTYTAPDGTTKTNTIKSAIKQNADNISLRVEKNGVIAAINASTESSGGSAVKISADKVNIEGAAIFTSGRLSTTNLNNTIDGRIPAIPDDISDLTDTTGKIPTKVSDLPDSSNYAKTTDIPDVSGLASKTDTVKSVTTEVQYRLSNSSTSLTGSGTGYSWSTTIPTWSSNKYLWTRIATTYTPISGNATTVYTPGIPDNQYGIYDSQLTTALSTASSAQTTANGAAASVTTTQEYNLSSSTSSANGTWQSTVPTWSANHYIWVRLKIVKTPMSGTASTSYTPSESGTYDKALTTALSTAASAKTTADAAAPKTSAVAEEQYIYISKASGTTSVSSNTVWVTETGDKQNTWTTKRPTYNTSYPVLFVAKQKKVVSGTVTCTTPVKDDTTTIIDGGHITTGTIDSNRLNADTIKVNAANIQGSLTIGQLPSTVAETSDIPTKVSELTNDSGYQNSTQVSSAINEVRSWYATCSTAAGTAAKIATITPITTAFTTSVLTAGTLVNVKFTVTNTAAVTDLTLNINNTGAKHIKTLRYGVISNIAGTGYLAKDTTYQFTYDGTYWVMQENYNADTINRTRWQNVITAAEAITNGHIICGTASGYRNIAANVSFDMDYPLLYAGTAIAKGATTGTRDNNFLEINSINASSNGTITSGAANKVLFLKGTLTNNTFKIAASPFMTTVTPTTQDNFCYIPLGIMYSATNIYFRSSDQLYAYKDGAFGPVSVREASAASKTATSYITDIDSKNGITIKAINGETSGSDADKQNYIKLNANGLDIYKGGDSVAFYGDTARIGKVSSDKIEITPTAFSASNSSGVEGFRVELNAPGVEGWTPATQDKTNVSSVNSGTITYSGIPSGSQLMTSGDASIYFLGTTGTFNATTTGDLIYGWGPLYNRAGIYINLRSQTFTYGTSKTITDTMTARFNNNITQSYTVTLQYNGSNKITITVIPPSGDSTDMIYFPSMYYYGRVERSTAVTAGSRSGATGAFSIAMGEGLIASEPYSVAFGSYNDANETYRGNKILFSLGNGTANDVRSNAFCVDAIGDIYVGLNYTPDVIQGESIDKYILQDLANLGWDGSDDSTNIDVIVHFYNY